MAIKERKAKPSHSALSKLGLSVILLVMVLLFGIAVTACTSQGGDMVQGVPTLPVSPSPVSTPTQNASSVWTSEPTPPLMDKVWQPPQPKKHVTTSSQPTELSASPDAMITYEVVSLGGGGDMKISKEGVVSLFGYRETVWTLQLSPDRLQALLSSFDNAHFFDLSERYIEGDPPGVIREMSYVTITYNKDGQSKSIQTRGSSLTPLAYVEVERTLSELEDEVRNKGTVSKRPDALVDYMMIGSEDTWVLDVDIEGGLYYGTGHVDAHLSQDDLKSLKDALTAMGYLGSDVWLAPSSEVRDVLFMSEHRAIVSTYKGGEHTQRIDMVSGADIPPGLQTVLDKLAEFYDKYVPGQ